MTDYYQILGIEKNTPEEDIKKAYRTLVKKYHPDVAVDKKEAEEKFKQISEAYEVLSDPQKRANYDRSGEPLANFDWENFTKRHDFSDLWNDILLQRLIFFNEIRGPGWNKASWAQREPLKKGNCLDCDGTGQKRIDQSYSSGNNHYVSIHIRPCDKCGGSGND